MHRSLGQDPRGLAMIGVGFPSRAPYPAEDSVELTIHRCLDAASIDFAVKSAVGSLQRAGSALAAGCESGGAS